MKDYKLLLTCILKDDSELEIASRMLTSFMPFCQGLAVAITGLSGENKKLQELITKHGGKFVITTPDTHPKLYSKDREGKLIFSNFAEARNVSFQLASQMQNEVAYDYWTWADVDDVLVGGEQIKLAIQKMVEMNLDQLFCNYWYSVVLNEKQQITDVAIDHLRERFMKPNIYHWISRLHEVAVPIDPSYQPRSHMYDYNPKESRNLAWAHITDEVRVIDAMKRNIEILNIQIKEQDRKDPRTIMYLAKTHYDLKTPIDMKISEDLFFEYLQGPYPSGWAEERSNAWEYLGNLYCLQNKHKEAIQAYNEGLKEFPRLILLLSLAKEYQEINMDAECEFWLNLALKSEPPQTTTTIHNPHLLKVMTASLKYNQAIKKLDLKESIYWLKIRNELTNGQNTNEVATLERLDRFNEAGKFVFNYAKWLKDEGHTDKIKHLLKSLPNELGREQFAFHIANEINEPKSWKKNEIAYYASWMSEHFEKWSPKNLDSGIGGSETAVIELAKRWAKKGYKVTVYGDPREDAGEYDGVEYRPYYEMNWKDKFNILILWRSPHLLDIDIDAKKIYMDLHDVSSQLDWTDKRMNKVDKVFFKSKYHRSMLPKLDEDKAVIISNGI